MENDAGILFPRIGDIRLHTLPFAEFGVVFSVSPSTSVAMARTSGRVKQTANPSRNGRLMRALDVGRERANST